MTVDSTGERWLPRHRVEGPEGAPAVILGPSMGTSSRVWDPQAGALARTHRVVRWELPGHGRDGRRDDGDRGDGGAGAGPPPEGAGVDWLGQGVLALADALDIGRFAYAGISLGGAVGTWLAVHHPRRLNSLALLCTSARFGPPEEWYERAALVRAQGTGPMADFVPDRWFTREFVESGTARALVQDTRSAEPAAYARLCEVVARFDLRADLARITVPALVLAGREDPVTTSAHARELTDGIPGAGLVEVPHAAHLANVERPAPVLAALRCHLATAGAPPPP